MAKVRAALRFDGVELPGSDVRPVGPKSKREAADELVSTGLELDELQEALYAEHRRAVLLVLQGMDTSGKGGTIRHVVGLVNPQGVRIAGFKKPTPAERRHHFLWRIEKQLPAAGQLGVFDRSHYEDVLVPRGEGQLNGIELRTRYREINAFEKELGEQGITLIKCFLHISPETQKERLLARLADDAKLWKYNPHDLHTRAKWSQYQAAYLAALKNCGKNPWYVVPSDRKWYRNWAVGQLLLETLRELDPKFPPPDFDRDAEKERLVHDDPLR